MIWKQISIFKIFLLLLLLLFIYLFMAQQPTQLFCYSVTCEETNLENCPNWLWKLNTTDHGTVLQ